MSWATLLKKTASAFFVVVGVLGTLHFLIGLPSEYHTIWPIAFASAFGYAIGHIWRFRVRQK